LGHASYRGLLPEIHRSDAMIIRIPVCSACTAPRKQIIVTRAEQRCPSATGSTCPAVVYISTAATTSTTTSTTSWRRISGLSSRTAAGVTSLITLAAVAAIAAAIVASKQNENENRVTVAAMQQHTGGRNKELHNTARECTRARHSPLKTVAQTRRHRKSLLLQFSFDRLYKISRISFHTISLVNT
ncbi:unnamed protein product, partial [Trichogramma brassicae]